MGIVFTILLADFKQSGIIAQRVDPKKCFQGKMPIQCTDSSRFHGSYSSDFKKICGADFENLSPEEQRDGLSKFLFRKFSIDWEMVVMVPEGNKRRKTLSWNGFYITDEELLHLVDRVMTAYDSARRA